MDNGENMQYVLVINKIGNYEKWKSVFDKNMDSRMDNGSKEAHVFRNVNNQDEVVILYEWDNLDNAKQFFESPDLKAKMENAGVKEMPDVHLLEGMGRTSG